MPNRKHADLHAAILQFGFQLQEGDVGLFGHARQHPVALLGERKWALAPVGSAAALPVSRRRRVQFETVAAAIENTFAICRQGCPAAAAATTRSRKSRE